MSNKYKVYIYILHRNNLINNINSSFIAFEIKENFSVMFSDQINLINHKIIYDYFVPIKTQGSIHELL